MSVTSSGRLQEATNDRTRDPQKLDGKPREMPPAYGPELGSVRLVPTDAVVPPETTVFFAAYLCDAEGRTVGSVRLEWSAHDADGREVSIAPDGSFVAKEPGVYRVTARTATGTDGHDSGVDAKSLVKLTPPGVGRTWVERVFGRLPRLGREKLALRRRGGTISKLIATLRRPRQ